MDDQSRCAIDQRLKDARPLSPEEMAVLTALQVVTLDEIVDALNGIGAALTDLVELGKRHADAAKAHDIEHAGLAEGQAEIDIAHNKLELAVQRCLEFQGKDHAALGAALRRIAALEQWARGNHGAL